MHAIGVHARDGKVAAAICDNRHQDGVKACSAAGRDEQNVICVLR